MDKTIIESVLHCLDQAGAGLCPIAGEKLDNANILNARVAYYDLAQHIRSKTKHVMDALEDPVTGNLSESDSNASEPSAQHAPSPEQTESPNHHAKKPSQKNSGKPWSEDDLNTCLSMYHDQFSFVQIAEKIYRTPWSVALKLNQLGELGDEALQRLRIEYGKNDPIGTKKMYGKSRK